MSKTKSTKKVAVSKIHASNWKEAISYVEKEIKRFRGRIEKLQLARDTFERMDAEGKPWPGKASAA